MYALVLIFPLVMQSPNSNCLVSLVVSKKKKSHCIPCFVRRFSLFLRSFPSKIFFFPLSSAPISLRDSLFQRERTKTPDNGRGMQQICQQQPKLKPREIHHAPPTTTKQEPNQEVNNEKEKITHHVPFRCMMRTCMQGKWRVANK